MATPVTINNQTIDPQGRHRSHDAVNTDWVYLQSKEPLGAAELAQLRSVNAIVQRNVGSDTTYLARYTPSDLAPLRDLDFVKEANCYHTTFKLSPELKQTLSQSDVEHHDLHLVLQPGAPAGTAQEVAAVAALTPGVDPTSIRVANSTVTLRASAQAVNELQKQDNVGLIQAVTPMALFNNLARIDMHAKLDDNPISPVLDSRGAGQIVCVNDSGFDRGDLRDVHPAFSRRVLAMITSQGARDASDSMGHGTHVSGSVLGAAQSVLMGGDLSGTAPNAHLVVQSLINGLGQFAPPGDVESLMTQPYLLHGVRICNNSWGQDWNSVPRQVAYDTSCDTLDAAVWKHPDLVVVVAAGNAGEKGGPNDAQVSSLAAAKNCITVGATYSSRPVGTGYVFNPASNVPGDPSVYAPFSSRGPTLEQRIKPDVVAPGTAILSAASRMPLQDPAERTRFGFSSDPLYMFNTGTSMASPLVAGCCAVLRESLQMSGKPTPSAALIKALVINGALAVGETHDNRSHAMSMPSGRLGWGRIDLQRSVIVPGLNSEGDCVDNTTGLDKDEMFTISIPLLPPVGSDRYGIKASLVWTDAPGSMLQCVLALELMDFFQPASPSRLAKGYRGDQPLDNVQQLIAQRLPEGHDVRLTVRCIKQATFNGHNVKQPFAVVWSRFVS